LLVAKLGVRPARPLTWTLVLQNGQMIRLFVDTEFTDMLDCELLSVGIVSEDGREFYMERNDVDLSRCGDFARVAVLPQLGDAGSMAGSEPEVSAALNKWLEQFRHLAPVVVSVDHPIDWELVTYLIRDSDSLLVPGWIKGQSIAAAIAPADVEKYWRINGRRSHHALHDARANRYAFQLGARG
jgi:hypothetical protein